MSLVLKNCIFQNKTTDLLIEKEKIESIGLNLKGDQDVDCTNLVLLPGLVDSHVHFREPGFAYKEDWLSGSQAGAAGGVTCVLDMPNTNPATVDQASLDLKRKLAKKSIVNYGFYLGATQENVKLISSRPVKEHGSLYGADLIKGVCGIKIYYGSTTGNLLLNDPNILKEFFKLKNLLFLIHAEDEKIIQSQQEKYRGRSNPNIHSKIRPPAAAASAIQTILKLSEKTNPKIHFCHISTKVEIELIKKAKEDGQNVTCEVTPHHLFLNEKEYATQGNFVKMNPPLRSEEDRKALWQGIKDGIIDTIVTDHAPHTKEEKEKDYWKAPAGVPGLETMLPLLLNEVSKGNLTIEEVVEVTCKNPAKIFKIKNKGEIKRGYDADLVLVNLNLEKEIKNEELKTKCGWSPFNGWKLKGFLVMTIVNGNIVYDGKNIYKNFKGKELEYDQL